MTEKLYLEDSSVGRFEATVERLAQTDNGARSIVLDRTHFYPTGGGQPHDTGVLRSTDERWRVSDVTGRTDVRHHVPNGAPLPEPGTRLEGRLDWDRRHALMRYHTAQHLLSAVLLDSYDAPTAGNQLYPDRARIDCTTDRFGNDERRRIERAVNDHIEANLSVTWFILDRDEATERLDPERTRLELLPDHLTEIRIVAIEGLDRTACAGTHVSSTGELGRFRLTGRETGGSGRERLRFVLEDT